MFFTDWFYYLPNSVLASIIIVAVINLIDFKDTKLDNITIDLPSAQVKSCIIFSLLGTRKKIRIYEKFQTRNHLELMIESLFKE